MANLVFTSNRTNLVVILVMMQVSKKIPFDNPTVLLSVRTLYIASNIFILGLYLYVRSQINKKKGSFASHSSTFPAYLIPPKGGFNSTFTNKSACSFQ